MDNMAHETTNAGYYSNSLRRLDADGKLDPICLLSQSIKTNPADDISLESLFGAYKSEESAKEFIEE